MIATTTTTTTIRCPICGQMFGESDGERLYVGAAYCDRVVTLRCTGRRCAGRVVWQPTKRQTTADRTGVLAGI